MVPRLAKWFTTCFVPSRSRRFRELSNFRKGGIDEAPVARFVQVPVSKNRRTLNVIILCSSGLVVLRAVQCSTLQVFTTSSVSNLIVVQRQTERETNGGVWRRDCTHTYTCSRVLAVQHTYIYTHDNLIIISMSQYRIKPFERNSAP